MTTTASKTATTPALQIRGVTKTFDRITALDDVTFDVPRGSISGLLGPNGAGKTTLFSIIASFLHADAGRIQVLGVDIAHISQLQGRMTILPQDARFQRNVPIVEQLAFLRMLDGSSRAVAEDEVRHTLDLVGLSEYAHRGVHALSHGMIKRMGIAQAFLGEPEVILLDEPTAGLDPQNAKQIRDLIQHLQQLRGATTVISSHNLLEIQDLCDHVAILDEGALISCGTVDEVTGAGRSLDVKLSRALTDGEQDQLKALAEVVSIEAKGSNRYVLSLELTATSDADAVTAKLLRALLDLGVTPRGVATGSTLEEFFLRVTAKAGA
jgi:ABC-type multidrug transport system ATPase subunit